MREEFGGDTRETASGTNVGDSEATGSGEDNVTGLRDVLAREYRRDLQKHSETRPAIVLVFAIIAAIVWANLASGSYESFWETSAAVQLGSFGLDLTFAEWLDEGLMTLFFLMIGLEVRHELAYGLLSDRSKALLPLVAGLSGMVFAIIVFQLLAAGSAEAHAWGSVVSTDTAIALGLFALLVPGRPLLRAFLLALAVVDDIATLAIIAVFYTEDLTIRPLILGFVLLGGAWLLQRALVWRSTPYIVIGFGVWLCFLSSGIHATLAGVLLAFLIPVHGPHTRESARRQLKELARKDAGTLSISSRFALIRTGVRYLVPLNRRITDIVSPWVNYLIVPLFALSNAGVSFDFGAGESPWRAQIFWAVLCGLCLGKPVGVVVGYFAVRALVPSARIDEIGRSDIVGMALLSGIGFTISMLVINLSLGGTPESANNAMFAVIVASLISGGGAVAVFKGFGRNAKPLAGEGDRRGGTAPSTSAT